MIRRLQPLQASLAAAASWTGWLRQPCATNWSAYWAIPTSQAGWHPTGGRQPTCWRTSTGRPASSKRRPGRRLPARDPDDQKFIDLAVRHQGLLLSKDAAVLVLAKKLAALQVGVFAAIPPAC